jgi:hypothetical protein
MRCAAGGAAGQHHAAVAAAEAAAHHLLERDVARASVGARDLRAGLHHRRRTADVQLHGVAERPFLERCLEGHGDATADAPAAVFGGEDDGDVHRLEQLDAVQFPGASGAVVERRRRLPCLQRGRQRDERRQADAAGDHPRLRRRIDRLERPAERAEERQLHAGLDARQQRRAGADSLVENRDARRPAAGVAEDLEDRERTPEQRILSARRLDHHELTRPRACGNLRRGE